MVMPSQSPAVTALPRGEPRVRWTSQTFPLGGRCPEGADEGYPCTATAVFWQGKNGVSGCRPFIQSPLRQKSNRFLSAPQKGEPGAQQSGPMKGIGPYGYRGNLGGLPQLRPPLTRGLLSDSEAGGEKHPSFMLFAGQLPWGEPRVRQKPGEVPRRFAPPQ